MNDDEEPLTHYGQSLAENLQDTIGRDSEEEKEDVSTGMAVLKIIINSTIILSYECYDFNVFFPHIFYRLISSMQWPMMF